MKISVQFEADSIEEAQAFFSMFHKQEAVPVEARVVSQPLEAESAPLTTLVQDVTQSPVIPEPKIEAPIAPTKPEPVAVKPPEKPARGRPAKKAVEPQPKPEAAVEPALVEHSNGVSRKDLLDVFSEYIQRYGANFGYADVSKLLQQNLGDGVRKASDVPDSALGMAISAIKTAITDNPFNRKVDYA
jgi:hypothetical protein